MTGEPSKNVPMELEIKLCVVKFALANDILTVPWRETSLLSPEKACFKLRFAHFALRIPNFALLIHVLYNLYCYALNCEMEGLNIPVLGIFSAKHGSSVLFYKVTL